MAKLDGLIKILIKYKFYPVYWKGNAKRLFAVTVFIAQVSPHRDNQKGNGF